MPGRLGTRNPAGPPRAAAASPRPPAAAGSGLSYVSLGRREASRPGGVLQPAGYFRVRTEEMTATHFSFVEKMIKVEIAELPKYKVHAADFAFALCAAFHPRLGQHSLLNHMDQDVTSKIMGNISFDLMAIEHNLPFFRKVITCVYSYFLLHLIVAGL